MNRRRVLCGVALGAVAGILPAGAARASVDALIENFTGGAPVQSGTLRLVAPEIAENGNAVGIEVECPGARAIRLLAPGNPNPEVCTFRFGALSGSTRAHTRIRMAETMDVIALAEMEDGTYQQASARVRVTIGGCGG